MKKYWINIAALMLGVIPGSSAFSTAKAVQPPVDWQAVPFAFVGSLIGTIFILGIQILRRDHKYGRIALVVFRPISIFIFGAGASALVIGAISDEFRYASVFFVVIGIGLLIGVVLSGVVFRARFKNAL